MNVGNKEQKNISEEGIINPEEKVAKELLIKQIQSYNNPTLDHHNKAIVAGIFATGTASLNIAFGQILLDAQAFELTRTLIWMMIHSGIGITGLVITISTILSKIKRKASREEIFEDILEVCAMLGVDYNEVAKGKSK